MALNERYRTEKTRDCCFNVFNNRMNRIYCSEHINASYGSISSVMKTNTIFNIKIQTSTQRTALRKKAFTLFEKKTRPCDAAHVLHVHAATVARWFRRFAKDGEAVVKEDRRGPKPGHDKNKLGIESLQCLNRVIRDKTPEQLKFPFALWSSRAIVEYVGREFKVKISSRTARRYMQKFGYTYQCSVKAAREQSAPAVRKCLTEEYPEIKKEAAQCGATILWGDESCVMAAETKCRGYSPKGVSPVLRKPANRVARFNFISAVGNRGDLFFRTFKRPMNVEPVRIPLQGGRGGNAGLLPRHGASRNGGGGTDS